MIKIIDKKFVTLCAKYNQAMVSSQAKNTMLHRNQEEAVLAKRAADGDGRALNKLVSNNMGFVINVAKEYQNNGVDLDDLVSEGSIALMNAILKWDPEKTESLVGYAVYDIRKAMEQTILKQGYVIRIPEGEERNIKSMDAPLRPGHTRSLGETMPQKLVPEAGQEVDNGDMADVITDTLDCLSERERQVVTLFYGIGCPHLTMAEIGEEMNLKRERVRQIRKKAERRMRKAYSN